MAARVLVTGTGAVCAAGNDPAQIWESIRAGRSSIAPIRSWDSSRWPRPYAGEIADLDPRKLVSDRKVHKLIRRTDLLGLYAAGKAIEAADFVGQRDGLSAAGAAAFNDRSGVYVASGGSSYRDQYDFFPLLTRSRADLPRFGRELAQAVNPMWLLRTLPNNVLCHIGIRYGFTGPNACIVNHSVGGLLALGQAAAALRCAEVDRAVSVAHEAPIEPQRVQYFDALGLLARDTLRPFDKSRSGSLLGEGAAAMALETAAAARRRGASVIGEVLGSSCTTEAQGLLAVRPDGEGLARAIALALDDAGVGAAEIGMIVAHANGTRRSDASEAAAIRRVFGPAPPPVTGFKWAFGHLLAGSGLLDAVLALESLRRYEVPGIATLGEVDRDCEGLTVSAQPQTPRGDIGLVLSRGFAGTNAALVVAATG